MPKRLMPPPSFEMEGNQRQLAPSSSSEVEQCSAKLLQLEPEQLRALTKDPSGQTYSAAPASEKNGPHPSTLDRVTEASHCNDINLQRESQQRTPLTKPLEHTPSSGVQADTQRVHSGPADARQALRRLRLRPQAHAGLINTAKKFKMIRKRKLLQPGCILSRTLQNSCGQHSGPNDELSYQL
eukprot:724775-Amphidinium_carterae.3